MFKETGHQNAFLFVPKSMFEAEEKNAEGFAKECDCYALQIEK
jgi:prolyl-tRNA synthetase